MNNSEKPLGVIQHPGQIEKYLDRTKTPLQIIPHSTLSLISIYLLFAASLCFSYTKTKHI